MTSHPSSRSSTDAPLSAEEWLARLLSPDNGAEDSEVFERWRVADPEHAAAYAEAERIHHSAALLSDDPLLRAAARAARRDTARRRSSPQRQMWLLAAGIAASLLLTVGLVRQGGVDTGTEQHYANTIGLPQTLQLADGTRLRLDAESSLTVRLGPGQRVATLEHGRVQFTVAHDPQRPFLVRAGNSTIRDIGTIFQVSRDADGVTVGLLKGKVAVSGNSGNRPWSSELKPAQQLHIDGNGTAGAIAPLDLAVAQGWTHGELAFRERRLDDLLSEMNRYSKTQLRLGDPSLAGLEVSGSFHAGDQEALAKALARGWQLRVVRTAANELTLLPADTERQR
ncbi:MAG: FecR domain-containing protein [Xanthomonadaceae bacterium]|jgi:transmembrane sensor|nr:FecR domain-containing protein [Xanthomonadaceae bacterium]MDE3073531.1 FecR domain-containing protein [Pseudomonadota bacterium]